MLQRLGEHGPFTAILSLLEPTEWELVLRTRTGLRTCLTEMRLSLMELAPQWMWLHGCSNLGTAMATVNNQGADCEDPCLQAALVGTQLFGLDVNGADPVTGITALMVAAEEGHACLCRLLISRRADVNVLSRGGTNALEMCFGASTTCVKCCMPACRCASRLEVVRQVLPVTTCNLSRAWAGSVRLAVQQQAYCQVVRDFAEVHGMCVNDGITSWCGRTESLLGIALESHRCGRVDELQAEHRVEVVKLLLDLKADPRNDQSCADWVSRQIALTAVGEVASENVQMLDLLWGAHSCMSTRSDKE
mmetsp:Transcript_31207/g.71244  ORF Transcript_31207/g.71244 Transcript_31207/m.71244 type:complete len:305 (+) Transcript_31207:118-1032(+)